MRTMHGMLAIKPAKIEQAQKELVESCKIASQGIQTMYIEDRAQTIREMENALQSPDPYKELFRIDADLTKIILVLQSFTHVHFKDE
ncbi:hypothetical protein DAPPUDRAFT_333072 [Daphnia pulex]|uniref:Uncharacterized protein n=1 Tax=Daphnia pulex TaxID=6669 RepID=E9HRR9_DAPPU|nr:hypothetical protein DAPPUDRAFT_333072 [Daphnia pulex]|eukprot:EFX65572.1 hypothetical protein DAPPUDRAFT_333072 [Daphnia pulex]